MKRRNTIYDIAREAGVSAKTVSKVVNNKAGVSAETRLRIQSIVIAMGYHPHHGARTLRSRHSNCVGVTMAPPLETVPLSGDFLLWLFAKLSEVFSVQGAYLAFDMTPRPGEENTDDYGRGVWEQLYDVCLVVGPLPLGDTVLPRIHAAGIPYLSLGRLDGLDEGSTASVDFREGAYKSTRFLLDRGHRRIAFLSAFEGYQSGLDRIRGYEQALRDFDIPLDDTLIHYFNPGRSSLVDVVVSLLEQPGVTGLVDSSVSEDSSALRQAATRAGRTFGPEFETVIWTYMKDAAVLSEATAHLWVPVREAAMEGIEALARWASGDEEGPVHIQHKTILTDVEHHFAVRKPKRLYDLL
ncbi:MAG: LacI family DNA-binding transcriptional regulator [Candidatus Hydrogenedentes bacterium]|nr:LacI family DNA-binding transcriptional regulator [Candidatus Hydrogenedentota bacterium]